jgi:hypothetical protein
MALQYDTPIPTSVFSEALYNNAGVSASTADAISALLGLNDPASTTLNVASWDGVDPSTIDQPEGTTPDVLALAVDGTLSDDVTVTLPDSVASAPVIIINSDANVTLSVGEEVNPNARAVAGDLIIQGGNGSDTITVLGNSNVRLDGGDGNDALTTGSGNDVVIGGAGHNVISTGAGSDTVIVGAGTDIVDTGEGRDLIEVLGTKADYNVQVIGNTLSLAGTGAADGKSADITNAEFLTFNDGHTLAIASTDEEASALRLYEGLLGRDADNGGAEAFTNAINGGVSLTTITQSFLDSAEYKNTVNDDFVENLYHSLLGRDADAGGEAAYLNALANGVSRADVLTDLSNSEEALAKGSDSATFVDSLYESALGRHAEAEGLDNWVTALNGGASRADIATQIFASTEAAAKSTSDFVDSLYQSALGREADAEGKANWTNALDHGMSQAQVAIEIVGSTEGQDHNTNVVVVHGVA